MLVLQMLIENTARLELFHKWLICIFEEETANYWNFWQECSVWSDRVDDW